MEKLVNKENEEEDTRFQQAIRRMIRIDSGVRVLYMRINGGSRIERRNDLFIKGFLGAFSWVQKQL